MAEVWVRGEVVKVWSTGEVDVVFDYPGGWDKPETLTFEGKNVITPRLPGHLSDCDSWSQGVCSCGAFVA